MQMPGWDSLLLLHTQSQLDRLCFTQIFISDQPNLNRVIRVTFMENTTLNSKTCQFYLLFLEAKINLQRESRVKTLLAHQGDPGGQPNKLPVPVASLCPPFRHRLSRPRPAPLFSGEYSHVPTPKSPSSSSPRQAADRCARQAQRRNNSDTPGRGRSRPQRRDAAMRPPPPRS
jgi:hypothetical protein